MVNEVCKLEGKIEEAKGHVRDLESQLRAAKISGPQRIAIDKVKEYLTHIACDFSEVEDKKYNSPALKVQGGLIFNLGEVADKLDDVICEIDIGENLIYFPTAHHC